MGKKCCCFFFSISTVETGLQQNRIVWTRSLLPKGNSFKLIAEFYKDKNVFGKGFHQHYINIKTFLNNN